MADMVALLNTIRASASAVYQDRIPEATRTNLEEIRYAMIDDDNIQVANEFTGTLLNKLVKSMIITKRFQNPLKSLKKGKVPLGDTIEEIYVNFMKGSAYDPTGANLLNRTLPDAKAVYHRTNFKMEYPVTISREELSLAFKSYDALESYITGITASLYNSSELDEYVNIKQLIKSALDNNALMKVQVADPTLSEENGREFIKSVKTTSTLMTFPSDKWNAYLTAQTSDTKPITTFSRKDEQILILSAAVDTSVSVDVLASVFNMSVADFNDTRKIVIDEFPDTSVRGLLVDEQFFQVYDKLNVMTEFHNGKGLYTNYYYHVWQTVAYSPLVNGVAFAVSA